MATTNSNANRYQRQLEKLLILPENQLCADCFSSVPRWASHNLGVFLCIRCAGVHRKMGTHISKVKSVTMDVWDKSQVDQMKAIGNLKSNAIFNPDPKRNPPPTDIDQTFRSNELEVYIRDKYERRRFMHQERLRSVSTGAMPTRSSTTIPTIKPAFSKQSSAISTPSQPQQRNNIERFTSTPMTTSPLPTPSKEQQQSMLQNKEYAPAVPEKNNVQINNSNDIHIHNRHNTFPSVPPTSAPNPASSVLNDLASLNFSSTQEINSSTVPPVITTTTVTTSNANTIPSPMYFQQQQRSVSMPSFLGSSLDSNNGTAPPPIVMQNTNPFLNTSSQQQTQSLSPFQQQQPQQPQFQFQPQFTGMQAQATGIQMQQQNMWNNGQQQPMMMYQQINGFQQQQPLQSQPTMMYQGAQMVQPQQTAGNMNFYAAYYGT